MAKQVEKPAATAVATHPELPHEVARRGIDEPTWRTLKNSIYPGAESNSILMAVDYCKARGLDVLKKPVHIVPMEVKDAKTNTKSWRDVILPGIYEYRTTAQRSGLYMGHTAPLFGPDEHFWNEKAPSWCEMTFYRWNEKAQQKVEFPIRVYFEEVAGTYRKDGNAYLNARWSKAKLQMLTKCCEAAGLREAFPEDLGGTHTDDEMYGQVLDIPTESVVSTQGKAGTAAPEAAPAQITYTEVPVLELRALIDKIGVPEAEFLAKFAAESVELLPLNKVSTAFEYLRGLQP